MKQQATIFVCDECGKRSKARTDGMPYRSGWVYLYNINGKLSKDVIIEERDKHFCSQACFVTHAAKLFSREGRKKQ